MAADQLPADEQQTKEELLFALHHRDKPTLAFVECKSTAKRDELAEFLQRELAEYAFYTIDLTPLTVASLLRTLDEELPAAIKDSPPVTYVVNVHGLENRLDEQLAAQLNLERELLFRNVPYITLIWADAYFFRKLQRLAPDLWHWVTYKFRFDDPTVQAVAQLPPLPPQRLEQRGDIEVRRERIRELEERYSRLDLSDSDKLRLLRDKLNTKSLLADEYEEAFEYPKAIAAYLDALGLEEQIHAAEQVVAELLQDRYQRGVLIFKLGWAYFQNQLFEEALETYNASLVLLPQEYSSIMHQIGIVHTEQGRWEDALESYHSALTGEQRSAQFDTGATYHQIGLLYAEQEQWARALENYKLALECEQRTGDISALGKTYHQIGALCAAQQQWDLALESYEEAIFWKKQADNTFGLGGTYREIGIVYAKQKQWAAALESYEQGRIWDEKTGNTFELAGAYYQIGQLHEAQDNLIDAEQCYEKAVVLAGNHPNLPMAQMGVARVREKLSSPPTP
jgi:tetratricopeptide (TPR) repeat protein